MSTYFSEKFKKLRKSNDLTQEHVAEIFHVSPQSVSRWETGINYPDIDLLPHIAVFFKVTIDELLGTEAIAGEKKANSYIMDIRNQLNSGKLDEAISTARKAAKEYPLNAGLAYHLVQALSTADSKTHKSEIIAISERIINMTDYKSSLLHRGQLIRQYAEWGMTDDAKRLLDTMPVEIWDTAEPWSGLVLDGDEWRKNQQHLIIRAKYYLEHLISRFLFKAELDAAHKIECHKAKMQIESLINTIAYDNPASEVNHLELAFEEIIIAELYCDTGDRENTLVYVEAATKNSLHHVEQMDKTNEDDGGNYMPWPTKRNLPWILWEDHLSKTLFDTVRDDARFAKCLETLQAHSRELM
ncbi:MAG: helix-turn-helix domain-containing protein [Defluviitaleaceae bacterium]|nr:helix-turn-helix domain-containing protein [Defluviitaleaceae bacterium]